MKRYLSSILAIVLLFCISSCTGKEQDSESEALTLTQNVASSSPALTNEADKQVCNNDLSSIGNVTSVQATLNTVTSEYLQPSSTNTPSALRSFSADSSTTSSHNIICSLPPSKEFNTNEELVAYLKSVDLREKELDVIAEQNIYLTPRLVEKPKSIAGKRGYKNTYISTPRGGGFRLGWNFGDDTDKNIFNVDWFAAKKLNATPIKSAEDLLVTIKNYSGSPDQCEIVTRGEKYYVHLHGTLFYTYEGYVVSVSHGYQLSSELGDKELDELLLLAEDIVYDKHTLR